MPDLDLVQALISEVEQLQKELKGIQRDLHRKEKQLLTELNKLDKSELNELGYKILFVRKPRN